jgi:putative hemolysin
MLVALALPLLIALLVVSAYASRLYTESGKFLSLEFQENIDIFEHQIEPRLGVNQARAALSFALLEQLFTAAIWFLLAYSVFSQPQWSTEELVQAVLIGTLAVLIFDRFLPYLFFSRTKGAWLVRFTLLLRMLIWLVFPLTLLLALIEAGQDEGILEESDRDLIHSVVEFGDKTVREVMTPRPSIVAVSVDTTVEQLTHLLSEHPYSRVPVYQADLDHIVGIVSARDLLQVRDTEAARTLAGSLMKTDIYYVPESKRANELLNELQRANRRMAIVIDEYGGVAGLVTVEDLIEEIVGELSNEGELRNEAVRESDTSYIVAGNLDTDRLEELFNVPLTEDWHATTVGGLVTEIAGHIPLPGEVLQQGDLRFEVLESTTRRVEKVRVVNRQGSPIPKNPAVE